MDPFPARRARATEALKQPRAFPWKRVNLVPDSGPVATPVLPHNKVAKGKHYNLFYAPKGEHKAATPIRTGRRIQCVQWSALPPQGSSRRRTIFKSTPLVTPF